MNKKFPWGRVLDRFDYDFDGAKFEVVKFFGREFKNGWQVLIDGQAAIDESVVLYHCEEIHQSADNLFYLLIAWIAYKQLGLNNAAFVNGISRALKLPGS